MGFSDHLQQFNRPEFLPEGWFWLLPSKKLRRGRAQSVKFHGHDLALYRGQDGVARALAAHCPHMGADLGDGLVEGNSLRCLFHNWKFADSGQCVEIPCQKNLFGAPRVRAYRVGEAYGLIWLWTGAEEPAVGIPEVPELAGGDVDFAFGNTFTKACHPNVVMINAIDAHHFNTVHQLIVDLELPAERRNRHTIRFANVTRVPTQRWFGRFVSRFYAGALTYDMTYAFGHTGTVTIGPDFLHFHIMFALRPTVDGRAEGQTVLITRRREGPVGRALNFALLKLTKIVGNYFAKGDTLIFSKIKFKLQTPVAADAAIIEFIKHYEEQAEASAFPKPPGARGARLEKGAERRSIEV